MPPSAFLRTTLAFLLAVAVLPAADPTVPPGPQAPQPPPMPAPLDQLGWSHEFHPGAFFTSVYVSQDAASSPDPTIQGSAGTLSYRAVFDGALGWRSETGSFDQKVHLAYGEVHQSGSGWQENLDELRYDGVYRRDLVKPTFAYRAWGLETVFTSATGDKAFDPLRVFGSWGVGQLYKDWIPGDAAEWRLGVRVQKSWGNALTDVQDDLQFGPEVLLRYERSIDPLRSFFAMYEGWSEFADLAHVTNVITAGVKVRLATYLALELGLRMYYESSPRDADRDATGYSRWFIRQDALIGVDAVF